MSLLTIHQAITWMIVGLIWVIQIIVYPQFRRVGAAEFRIYHFSHCLRIGLMIGPMFLWLFSLLAPGFGSDQRNGFDLSTRPHPDWTKGDPAANGPELNWDFNGNYRP